MSQLTTKTNRGKKSISWLQLIKKLAIKEDNRSQNTKLFFLKKKKRSPFGCREITGKRTKLRNLTYFTIHSQISLPLFHMDYYHIHQHLSLKRNSMNICIIYMIVTCPLNYILGNSN